MCFKDRLSLSPGWPPPEPVAEDDSTAVLVLLTPRGWGHRHMCCLWRILNDDIIRLHFPVFSLLHENGLVGKSRDEGTLEAGNYYKPS